MTLPYDEDENLHDHVTLLKPYVVDTKTGAYFVHKDYVAVRAPWVDVAGPVRGVQLFADVDSWAAFVKRYAGESDDPENDPPLWPPLLTWSERGLVAVLDYHGVDGTPGLCAWVARCDFEPSTEWKEWTAFANGVAHPQKDVVEKLEMLADDVVDPEGAALIGLLRALRGTYNATATTDLHPDGTSSIAFTKETQVRTGNMHPDERLELPPEIAIVIPVFKGDVDRFKLTVRLRVSVDGNAHLSFRFVIQGAERVIEQVAKERQMRAASLLGGVSILRGA